MSKTGWKRSLGTSKKEQGIETSKAPQNRRRKREVIVDKFESFRKKWGLK